MNGVLDGDARLVQLLCSDIRKLNRSLNRGRAARGRSMVGKQPFRDSTCRAESGRQPRQGQEPYPTQRVQGGVREATP